MRHDPAYKELLPSIVDLRDETKAVAADIEYHQPPDLVGLGERWQRRGEALASKKSVSNRGFVPRQELVFIHRRLNRRICPSRLSGIDNVTRLSSAGTVEISGRAGVIISAVSVPIALATLVGASALAATLHPDIANASVIEITVPFLAGIVGALLVHELIHAAAFLVLGGHPRFGKISTGGLPFLYVSCPGRRFARVSFIVVGLAPLIVLDLAAFALLTNLHTVGLAVGILTINTAGSVGDVWLSGIVFGQGRTTRWEAAEGHFVVWKPSSPP